MKSIFVVFILFFLAVFSAANYYVLKKLLWLTNSGMLLKFKPFIIFVVVFLAASFLLGRLWQLFTVNSFNEILVVSGSVWLGFLAYFLLSFFFLDFFSMLPRFFSSWQESKFFLLFFQYQKNIYGVFVFLASIFLLWGFFNGRHIQIQEYNLQVFAKNSPIHKSSQKLSIALASDIHIGSMIRQKHTEEIVDAILSTKPDIILLAGDTVDERLEPILFHQSAEPLKKLNAPLGVYGIAGNHEYIGNITHTLPYLREHGITILQDECVLINNAFILVGRDDASGMRMTGKKRKSLQEILSACPNYLPVIVLDHQPVALQESADEKVSLHFSGHTHHGQLWPFNFITEMMFPLSYGLEKVGDTWVYVSSGAGFWGPPFKTAGKAEIVHFNIEFVD